VRALLPKLHEPRCAAALALLGVLLCLGACRSIPGSRFVVGLATGDFSSNRISQQELRELLVQYAGRFEATIVASADTIAAGTKDPVIQRRTLRWKLNITPVVNQAAFMKEPEAAYVAMLTVATSMHDYLAHGGGTQAFGEQQKVAIDASEDLLRAAIEVGDRFLEEKELARVTADVEELVRAHPIRGEFVAEQVQSLVASSESTPIFEWVTAIPLSPIRALQGVDQGAQAIRDFNVTAMEMARIVASMPQLIRWNMELLAFDVSQQGDIADSLESFNALARSAETLSQAAQSLPESLRELLDEAEHTGQSLGPLSQSLERSATAVAEAGKAWGGLVAELSKPPADPTKPSRPFDIREWQETAAQIGTSANELRAFATEINSMSGTPLEAAIDRASLRAAQLVALFFGLLVAYRLLAWRLGRTRRDG
jgi:hypothetical protein